jgi:hypothetical protein
LYSLVDTIARIDVPVLILTGDEDELSQARLDDEHVLVLRPDVTAMRFTGAPDSSGAIAGGAALRRWIAAICVTVARARMRPPHRRSLGGSAAPSCAESPPAGKLCVSKPIDY